MKTKELLYDILMAFCFASANIQKVQRLAGVKNSIWNGKRDKWKAVEILTRAIPEHKAQEIINQMPFPFIEHYYPTERPAQEFFSIAITKERTNYWINEVLRPAKHIEIM